MQPLVSIITVTFNAKKLIADTIESVLAQTWLNYELIVIDGASTDGTLEILRKYESHIKLLSEPDKGIYDAMNKGISRAKGDWIYFLNAGDRFYDHKVLEDIFSREITGDIEMVYGKVRTMNYPGGIDITIGNEVRMKDFHYRVGLCHQAVFTRASAFTKIGNYNASRYRIIADQEWFVRFFGKGLKGLYIDRIIAWYDAIGESSIHRMRSQREHMMMVNENFPGGVRLQNRIRDPFILTKIFLLKHLKDTILYHWYRKVFFSDQK
jgi:glycosyltransferase involved in cell wall biosynthesis